MSRDRTIHGWENYPYWVMNSSIFHDFALRKWSENGPRMVRGCGPARHCARNRLVLEKKNQKMIRPLSQTTRPDHSEKIKQRCPDRSQTGKISTLPTRQGQRVAKERREQSLLIIRQKTIRWQLGLDGPRTSGTFRARCSNVAAPVLPTRHVRRGSRLHVMLRDHERIR